MKRLLTAVFTVAMLGASVPTSFAADVPDPTVHVIPGIGSSAQLLLGPENPFCSFDGFYVTKATDRIYADLRADCSEPIDDVYVAVELHWTTDFESPGSLEGSPASDDDVQHASAEASAATHGGTGFWRIIGRVIYQYAYPATEDDYCRYYGGNPRILDCRFVSALIADY